MNEADVSKEVNPLDALAEEFVARYRNGERPALSEYIKQHPQLADEIVELFPALVMMEDARPGAGEQTDGFSGVGGTASGKKLERLGDYRILREVGRGGMGIVYEAEQESLGRHVALKVLPMHSMLDPRHLQRFECEARAAARLHHTNIVPVFGIGDQDGLHYYVMQFIQGLGLDEVLVELKHLRKTGRSTREIAADVGRSLQSHPGPVEGIAPSRRHDNLSAIQAAQALLSGQFCSTPDGAVQQTGAAWGTAALSPSHPTALSRTDPADTESSMLVRQASDNSSSSVHLPGQAGHTSLSDTGREYWHGVARVGVQVADALAYANSQGVLHRDIKPSNLLLDTQGTVWVTDFGLAKATGSDDLTHTGDIIGTLRYLAPERLRGHSDQRSDIYSLGVTLYELLTLRPAFEELDRNRLVRQLSQDEPPRPRSIAPEIPRDLETIVLKAIAKDARDRYSSPSKMAEDLRRFLADRPIMARQPALWERTWRLCRRNPLVSSLIGSVAALLVLGAVISVAYSVRLAGELAKTARAEQGERNAKRDALDKLWQSYLEQAKAQHSSRRIGQRFEGLRAVQDAQALASEIELSPRRLDALRNAAIASLVLPDLRRIREWEQWPAEATQADIDNRGERYARSEAPGTVTIRHVADDSEIARLTGLGKNILPRFAPNGRSIGISWDGGFKVWNLNEPRPDEVLDLPSVRWWGFSPDSRRLAVAFKDGKLELFDVESALPVRSLGMMRAASWPEFSPNGQYVAVGTADGMIHIVDVNSGNLVRELPLSGDNFDFDWHADSKTLAIGVRPEGIFLWDVLTGMKSKVLPHPGGGMRVVFNATGDLLLSHSWWDGGLRLWNPHTGQLLLSGSWSVGFLASRTAPDGRMLLFGRFPQVALWEVKPGRAYRTQSRASGSLSGELTDCALSPDVPLLVATSKRGLTFWDLVSGTQLAVAPIPSEGVAFDPAGQLFTSGPAGLFRWPVLEVTSETGKSSANLAGDSLASNEPAGRVNSHVPQLRIGPPQVIAALPSTVGRRFGTSRDGRVVAVSLGQGASVIHLDRPDSPISLGPHEDVRFASVSPDGQFVATGSWLHGAKVWDAASGKLVKDLPVGNLCQVVFSPDGRWLATSSEGGQLWRVGTWEKGASLGGIGTTASGLVFAFSPPSPRPNSTLQSGRHLLEGSILAMAQSTGVIRLVDPETGRDLAELTDPQPHRVHSMRFSPDGSKLLTTLADELGVIQIWDLKVLRAELTALGLDWGWPPLPTGTAEREYTRFTAQINAGSDSTTALTAEETARRYIDRLRADYAADPNNVAALNALAWILATAPDKLRRLDEALTVAEKVAKLAPGNALYMNTLGVVYYRHGRFREAADCLEANLSKQEDSGLAFDLYFLAMSYHMLGEQQRARELLTWANRWTESRTPKEQLSSEQLAELAEFRAEAEKLIGK